MRLAGIEPTTPWFVAKYSIQLSYSRAKPLSIAMFRIEMNKAVHLSAAFQFLVLLFLFLMRAAGLERTIVGSKLTEVLLKHRSDRIAMHSKSSKRPTLPD